jgi:hypothetical protein
VPLAGAVTMLLPLVVVPAVSLMTAPPDKELLAKAFGEGEPTVSSGSGH